MCGGNFCLNLEAWVAFVLLCANGGGSVSQIWSTCHLMIGVVRKRSLYVSLYLAATSADKA